MRIKLEEYNPNWVNVYSDLEYDIKNLLHFLNPIIEHIGSTSVPDMVAKPIIDIIVGVPNDDQLDHVINPMVSNGYIYYENFNTIMPYRRFFVKAKPGFYALTQKDIAPNEINEYKLAHIHVLKYGSFHWTRHIAFREYLKNHPKVKNEYQELKISLSERDWQDGNAYNDAKNAFIKHIEEKAIEWWLRELIPEITKNRTTG